MTTEQPTRGQAAITCTVEQAFKRLRGQGLTRAEIVADAAALLTAAGAPHQLAAKIGRSEAERLAAEEKAVAVRQARTSIP